ncbi:hypothetical protein ACVWY1_001138 [Pseudomonas sp. TE6288]|jgi:hypothetical protein|uniref:hypothetical protein n=1 Tax=unclassified Pseudomonas TaxID=196821 RepID=UPI0011AF7717|nr:MULTISPECIES: hypothetical protein [unclassified Pseudomonas]
MNKRRIGLMVGWLVIVTSLFFNAAKADPRPVLAGMIQQLQTGTPNQMWYGPQLWQTIAMQTGNSGYYPALAALGPVTNITVIGSQGLPGGAIFNLVATHQGGQSTWFMGIGALSNRIEYANFNIGANLPSQPIPNPTPTPTATPSTPTSPSNDGGACSMYPDLC